jgi:two-component system, NtrC family, response regulator AtoC
MARMLVAEDDEAVRAFLVEALELFGHQVTQARDGQQAAALLGKQGFDVLLSDLRMPRIDGMELLQIARAQQPDMQVILLTAHGSIETAVEAMRQGAFDYLQKPLKSLDTLRLLVERALERRNLQLAATRERVLREDGDDIALTYGAPAMAPVVDALRRVAGTNATVLLTGESGTGKEVAARALHRWSARADGPFIAINCAALAEGLLESELFGHEKGAFTGAHARRQGKIELADEGTLFLDELGELKLDVQAKLLRVLEEQRFERVGGSVTLAVNVRLVAATNRGLEQMVAEGKFREDLYHRLAVFPVHLPPLRERRADIAPLARRLLAGICAELGRERLELGEAALRALEEQPWRGNIRALRNALERAAILCDGPTLTTQHLPAMQAPAPPADMPAKLDDLEREAIMAALAAEGGNRRRAADRLGIGLRTLYDKLKRYES